MKDPSQQVSYQIGLICCLLSPRLWIWGPLHLNVTVVVCTKQEWEDLGNISLVALAASVGTAGDNADSYVFYAKDNENICVVYARDNAEYSCGLCENVPESILSVCEHRETPPTSDAALIGCRQPSVLHLAARGSFWSQSHSTSYRRDITHCILIPRHHDWPCSWHHHWHPASVVDITTYLQFWHQQQSIYCWKIILDISVCMGDLRNRILGPFCPKNNIPLGSMLVTICDTVIEWCNSSDSDAHHVLIVTSSDRL